MLMPSIMDRSQLLWGITSLSGLCALGGDVISSTEEPALSEKRLVLLGINALARAPEMNYFTDGHRGAAMIAAHLMCKDNHLDDPIAGRIVELLDNSWANSPLCQPFPDEDPVDDAVEKVGQALAEGNGVLREVGHDAIFAMHAIKAFRLLPGSATPGRVNGVCRLIREIKPWRDLPPDEHIDPPPFSDSAAASRFILEEACSAIDRFRGFGQGFSGHLLTFGQALVEMAAMGDAEWADSCRTAFRKYVTLTRLGPQPGDRRIADRQPSNLRPNGYDYWNQRDSKSLGMGHVFKYPYAYYDLLRRAHDPELAKTFEAKAYYLF